MISGFGIVMYVGAGFLVSICFQQSRVGVYDWICHILIDISARHFDELFSEDDVRLIRNTIKESGNGWLRARLKVFRKKRVFHQNILVRLIKITKKSSGSQLGYDAGVGVNRKKAIVIKRNLTELIRNVHFAEELEKKD
jgi:hypothetical protein